MLQKILVEDRLALQARTEKDLANYRSNTILSSSDLGLSNNTIIKNVFSSGNVEDKLQAMDNIVTLLNRSDDSGLALQGFQDSVTEYIFNTIKPTTKGGKKVLSLKSTTDFINDNMDLLTKVYGEESAQMWKEFGDTLVAIEPALLKGNVGALDVFSKQNIFYLIFRSYSWCKSRFFRRWSTPRISGSWWSSSKCNVIW